MIDLSAYYTKEEITNLLASYTTVDYVNNLIDSKPTISHETSLAMTGEELHLAILNKTLQNNVVVTCTEDYLDYKTPFYFEKEIHLSDLYEKDPKEKFVIYTLKC